MLSSYFGEVHDDDERRRRDVRPFNATMAFSRNVDIGTFDASREFAYRRVGVLLVLLLLLLLAALSFLPPPEDEKPAAADDDDEERDAS